MKRSRKNIIIPAIATESSHAQLIQSEQDGESLWQDSFVHFLLILVTGFVCYFNSINVPFIFDDYTCLIDNPVIKSFDCFPDTRKVFEYAILPDLKNNLILRPFAYFTFAINYALHGLNLYGYHIVNLLLHIGSGMLVYRFIVQLLATPSMAYTDQNGKITGVWNSNYLPLFAALLFVCHPLQTQAVTYIIQRFVPLTTFFYLAALVLYVQFRSSTTQPLRVGIYLLSFVSAVLAMESKEIAFTLPVIITIVEFMFFRGSMTQRFVRITPFILTMVIIPAKLMHLSSPVTPEKTESVSSAINLVNFGGISHWDYLMTQFGVITTYLRLLFLPIRQNLDYDYPLQQSFFKPEVLLPLALLLAIVGTGIYLLSRSADNRVYRIIAFGIFWFFITLSVESSIVPIDDLIFEHRAYLPSVGFFISFIGGVSVLFNRLISTHKSQSKISVYLSLIMIVSLSATTIARNMLWLDDVVFWNDVISKSPNKARAYISLGSALLQQAKYVPNEKVQNILEDIVLLKDGSEKQISTAIKAFKKAIQLEPNTFVGHISLAEALTLQQSYEDALQTLSTASKLQPKSALPYVIRGEVFAAQKKIAQARQQYLAAVKIEPFSPAAHVRLAGLYAKEGNIGEAIREFEIVMQINPDESVRKKLERLKKG